jgi:hypothetical protein
MLLGILLTVRIWWEHDYTDVDHFTVRVYKNGELIRTYETRLLELTKTYNASPGLYAFDVIATDGANNPSDPGQCPKALIVAPGQMYLPGLESAWWVTAGQQIAP